jgi:hypothetical protein
VTTAEDRLVHGRFCNTCRARPLPLRSRRPERRESRARSRWQNTGGKGWGFTSASCGLFLCCPLRVYSSPCLPVSARCLSLSSPLLSPRRNSRATPSPSPHQSIRFPEEMKFSKWFTVLNTRLCAWAWSVCALSSLL